MDNQYIGFLILCYLAGHVIAGIIFIIAGIWTALTEHAAARSNKQKSS